MRQEKSVSEIIAGALELMTRGPRGGKLKKARWIVGSPKNEIYGSDGETIIGYEFCALGALSAAAEGVERARDCGFTGKLREAGELVAEHLPGDRRSDDYQDVMGYNDDLSEKRGFTAIKRVFCKALKTALDKEGKRGAVRNSRSNKRTSKRGVKRNNRTK